MLSLYCLRHHHCRHLGQSYNERVSIKSYNLTPLVLLGIKRIILADQYDPFPAPESRIDIRVYDSRTHSSPSRSKQNNSQSQRCYTSVKNQKLAHSVLKSCWPFIHSSQFLKMKNSIHFFPFWRCVESRLLLNEEKNVQNCEKNFLRNFFCCSTMNDECKNESHTRNFFFRHIFTHFS